MAITFVNSCSGAGSPNSVTSSAMDTTGANLIVVSVATYGALGSNLTDSQSNTWTALSTSSNSGAVQRLFYCISPTTSSSHTFTFNQSSTYPSISAVAFSGVAAYESENTSTQTGLSTTIQTGSVTPSKNGSLVFAGACTDGGNYTAVDSGFTLETSESHLAYQHMGSASAYFIQTTSAAVNPQFTNSISDYLCASIAVFKPAKTGIGDEKLWLCPSLDDSADDISGNGNNGTYYNGLTTVADVSNGGTRAYLLDGINKRIECPASAIGSEPIISVSCWGYVNVHDSIFGEGLVSQFGAGTDSTKCKFVVNASNGGSSSIFPAVGIRPSTTNVSAVSTNAISAQSWHHFCLVADGSTIYNYVDGVLQASTAYTGSVRSVTNPFVIGTYNQLINSNHYLDGRIDDVRAFNRALTPTEITHLASTRGVAGSPYGFKGLGGEKLWLCPTLDDSAEDISGNRNHGTYNGGMSTVSDTASGGSRAYSFDGSNDYIDCGAASTIHSNSVFTYSIWIKASSNTGTTVGVFGAYDHTTGDRGALFAVGNNFSNKGAFYYQSVGSTYNSNELLQSTVNVVDGTWHHIVCVFDGVNGRALFYRDGTLVGNTASNVPSTVNQSTDFLVGRGAAANFSGYVDDARIFDRALTQEEVTHLAKSRGVLGSPHNLNGIVHLLSSFIHPFT